MVAIDTAARLNDIGFAEFTSKLVSDTFQTLVSSQIEQTQAFAELVRQTSKSLSDYINDTKDDVTGEEIIQLAQALLPTQFDANEDVMNTGAADVVLVLDEAAQLNRDLEVDGVISPSFTAAATPVATIREAIAKRISANKYEILVEIVRLGLIRLVVEDGFIDTKLSFKVEEYANARVVATKSGRTSGGFSAGLGILGKVFNLKASGGYSKVKVSFDQSVNNSGSSTDINIQGKVRINFKSDIPNNA